MENSEESNYLDSLGVPAVRPLLLPKERLIVSQSRKHSKSIRTESILVLVSLALAALPLFLLSEIG